MASLQSTHVILSFLGCITLALQYEEAGPIALCRTCDVIFSFVWQFAFLGIVPDLFRYVIIQQLDYVVLNFWIRELDLF